jgi:hypothetical protein
VKNEEDKSVGEQRWDIEEKRSAWKRRRASTAKDGDF